MDNIRSHYQVGLWLDHKIGLSNRYPSKNKNFANPEHSHDESYNPESSVYAPNRYAEKHSQERGIMGFHQESVLRKEYDMRS